MLFKYSEIALFGDSLRKINRGIIEPILAVSNAYPTIVSNKRKKRFFFSFFFKNNNYLKIFLKLII